MRHANLRRLHTGKNKAIRALSVWITGGKSYHKVEMERDVASNI